MASNEGDGAGDEATKEPIRPPATPTATRYCTNHDWCYRGDNTKPKGKK